MQEEKQFSNDSTYVSEPANAPEQSLLFVLLEQTSSRSYREGSVSGPW